MTHRTLTKKLGALAALALAQSNSSPLVAANYCTDCFCPDAGSWSSRGKDSQEDSPSSDDDEAHDAVETRAVVGTPPSMHTPPARDPARQPAGLRASRRQQPQSAAPVRTPQTGAQDTARRPATRPTQDATTFCAALAAGIGKLWEKVGAVYNKGWDTNKEDFKGNMEEFAKSETAKNAFLAVFGAAGGELATKCLTNRGRPGYLVSSCATCWTLLFGTRYSDKVGQAVGALGEKGEAFVDGATAGKKPDELKFVAGGAGANLLFKTGMAFVGAVRAAWQKCFFARAETVPETPAATAATTPAATPQIAFALETLFKRLTATVGVCLFGGLWKYCMSPEERGAKQQLLDLMKQQDLGGDVDLGGMRKTVTRDVLIAHLRNLLPKLRELESILEEKKWPENGMHLTPQETQRVQSDRDSMDGIALRLFDAINEEGKVQGLRKLGDIKEKKGLRSAFERLRLHGTEEGNADAPAEKPVISKRTQIAAMLERIAVLEAEQKALRGDEPTQGQPTNAEKQRLIQHLHARVGTLEGERDALLEEAGVRVETDEAKAQRRRDTLSEILDGKQ